MAKETGGEASRMGPFTWDPKDGTTIGDFWAGAVRFEVGTGVGAVDGGVAPPADFWLVPGFAELLEPAVC